MKYRVLIFVLATFAAPSFAQIEPAFQTWLTSIGYNDPNRPIFDYAITDPYCLTQTVSNFGSLSIRAEVNAFRRCDKLTQRLGEIYPPSHDVGMEGFHLVWSRPINHFIKTKKFGDLHSRSEPRLKKNLWLGGYISPNLTVKVLVTP